MLKQNANGQNKRGNGEWVRGKNLKVKKKSKSGTKVVNVSPKQTDLVSKTKSPSGTTIYALALNREITPVRGSDYQQKDGQCIIANVDQISRFIENIRLESDRAAKSDRTLQDFQDKLQTSSPHARRPQYNHSMGEPSHRSILEAEKFKADVVHPTGNNENIESFNNSQHLLPDSIFNGLTKFLKQMAKSEDDEFFHITCHVDPSMKAKIEKGEFVDLEKLLPKDRYHKVNQDCAMTLVNRNGLTYFVPADSGSKITNVRRWKQALRVYAAVYSNANPNRSAEIWQYVYVINTAVSSFAWENVAYYDFTFRQLMHSNSTRSWGKMYLQLWNLAMKDPISAKAVSYTTTSENMSNMVTGEIIVVGDIIGVNATSGTVNLTIAVTTVVDIRTPLLTAIRKRGIKTSHTGRKNTIRNTPHQTKIRGGV